MEPQVQSNTQQLDFLEAFNFSLTETEKLTQQLQTVKEKLESELLQHNEYASLLANGKELSEKKKAIKKEAMKNSICQELSGEIKQLRGDLKESKKSLSGYALAYVKKTGTSEIRIHGGDVVKVQAVVKVGKSRKK